jgi:ribonuclease R
VGIKKEQVLSYLFREDYKPLTFEGLQKVLNIYKEEDIQELFQILTSLEKEGSVFKSLQGRYSPLRGMGLLVGVLQGHSQGYAFFLPEAPGEPDVFIQPEKLKGAMHKDRVVVRLQKGSQEGRRREGEVIRILKRSNPNVVGTYRGNRHGGVALPDDRRLSEIRIPKGSREARAGDKILINITRWPDNSHALPEGKIVEVIGSEGEPGVDITSIQKKFGFPSTFPSRVLKEVEHLDENHILEAAKDEGRQDLRSLAMVTIDDEDARDLDDAVSLERRGSGYRLGVHIADVSYYVKEGSALDREAARRATSVYFPDRVIPMLPPRLSNRICSLNPGALRLAISVFMDLNQDGKLEKYSFYPSVICIEERMTYSDVNRILEGDNCLENKYSGFVQVFRDMAALAERLKEKRIRRGALDFNFPEAKVKLDEQGKPLEIRVRRGGRAESIIEEFMLLCNEVIAAHFHRLKIPFVYRVHERPEGEKLYALRDFLSFFNIKLEGDLNRISPRQFQKIMEAVKDTPAEKIVNYVLLRSLPQARYSVSPLGHFGLATRYYTHFTSPIRRYPDLLVHRILRSTLEGTLTTAESRRLASRLPQLAEHSSEQERFAMEAERESVDLKKVELMEGKVGNEYSGVISGVTSFGFFVELDNTVEGLVHVTSLEDNFYCFNEKRYELVGERRRKVYRLGDSIRVRLERVDKETRTVYFTPLVPGYSRLKHL